MSALWICPDQLFDGGDLQQDMALLTDGFTVNRIAPRAQITEGAKVHNLPGLLTPGYVDLQVNGGGGVLLNQTPTREGMLAISAAHRRFGTVAILPTVITDAAEVLAQAVDAAIAAKGDDGLIGLHIEGPHIAATRRGTHAARYIRPLDAATIAQVSKLRDAGVPVMITLAPEAATDAQIGKLTDIGAVVSVGHTDATAKEAHAAFAAGAGCVTHLFNAMSQMENRAPGVVGAAINADVHAGIICDGHHVADEMIALACRARPVANRMFLVSDAMPTVGGPAHFDLYGRRISLQDGRLVNDEGSLAGAHVTQAQAVARLVGYVGLPLDEALRMAISVPAKLIGRDDLAGVTGRWLRDLVVLDANLAVTGTVADELPAVAAP